MNDKEKSRRCGEWLARCLSEGWRRADLDALEQLWWDKEGWRQPGWCGVSDSIDRAMVKGRAQ